MWPSKTVCCTSVESTQNNVHQKVWRKEVHICHMRAWRWENGRTLYLYRAALDIINYWSMQLTEVLLYCTLHYKTILSFSFTLQVYNACNGIWQWLKKERNIILYAPPQKLIVFFSSFSISYIMFHHLIDCCLSWINNAILI